MESCILLLPQPCLAMAVCSGKVYSSVMIAFLRDGGLLVGDVSKWAGKVSTAPP